MNNPIIKKFGSAILCALFGIVFIVVSIITINAVSQSKDWPEVEATISRIDVVDDDNHYVFVNYTVDGVEYTNILLNYYSSDMHEGKTLVARYNPEYPDDLHAPGADFVPYIFLVVGILTVIFAVFRGLKALGGR